MSNKDNNNQFNFIYSAKEQEEIKNIREKYSAPEENKMEKLRRLDGAVTKKATSASIAIGVIGALIMGTGMSLTMTSLGSVLGELEYLAMPIGIAVGILGMVTVALAYPVYQRVIKKQRKKIAPEIIRLTDELMK